MYKPQQQSLRHAPYQLTTTTTCTLYCGQFAVEILGT